MKIPYSIPPEIQARIGYPLVDNQEMRRLYLKKLRTYGRFYKIADMIVTPAIMGIYAAWDAERNYLRTLVYEADYANRLLLYKARKRESITGKGLKTDYEIKEEVRSSKEYKRNRKLAKTVKADLDHQFRREIECPLITRELSQEAYHIYLQIIQHEAAATHKRAYAFTIVNHFADRSNQLKALRDAGFIVHATVGCVTRHFKRGKPIENSQKPKKSKKKAKPRKCKNLWGRRCRGEGKKQEQPAVTFRELPHVHGLAIATHRVKGKPMDVLERILKKKTFVRPITSPMPKNSQATGSGGKPKKTDGRIAALAEGFLSYAVYMAQNYDQPCTIKNLKRYSSGRSTQKLNKTQKSMLHPKLTRGQLEAFNRAKEAIRVKIGAPKTGKQWWIMRHWKEIQAATKAPKYNYDAQVICRDGFEYTLSPDWDCQIYTVGVTSAACSFERKLRWQEKEADFRRLKLDPKKSKPIYQKTGGECELDIMLYLTRFRRVIEHGESPESRVYSYNTVSGQPRPRMKDEVLTRKGSIAA